MIELSVAVYPELVEGVYPEPVVGHSCAVGRWLGSSAASPKRSSAPKQLQVYAFSPIPI
jgi:hypothetical protein